MIKKDWVDLPRYGEDYINGVLYFLDIAFTKGKVEGEEILCPCVECCNDSWEKRDVVFDHLISNGFVNGYKDWIYHGEEISHMDLDASSRLQGMIENNDESNVDAFQVVFGKEHPGMLCCHGRNITETSLKQKAENNALKKAHNEEVALLNEKVQNMEDKMGRFQYAFKTLLQHCNHEINMESLEGLLGLFPEDANSAQKLTGQPYVHSSSTHVPNFGKELACGNAPQDNKANLSTDINSNTRSSEASTTVRGKADPAWEHFAYKKDGRTNVYICLHCGSTYKGGSINRMKQHLAGMSGQMSSCKKVSHDIRHRMRELLKDIQEKKKSEDKMQVQSNKGKRKANVEIGSYFAPRTAPGSQLSSKKAIHKTKMAITRWCFYVGIPFNAMQSPYFQSALDAITAIGPGFKGPSYHELRVNLLGDCKKECQLLVEGYRANWAKSGCTIMADGLNEQRQRTLINFLVYCPTGIAFVKSIDQTS